MTIFLANTFRFYINQRMALLKSLNWVDTRTDEFVNLFMTTATQFAEVFKVTIFLIRVDMMDFYSSFGLRAKLALMFKPSVSNRNVTPGFISRSIGWVNSTLAHFLAVFRTKNGRFLSIGPRFELGIANNATLFNSDFSSANHRTKSGCSNSIVSGMEGLPTTLAVYEYFRFQSHKEKLYA